MDSNLNGQEEDALTAEILASIGALPVEHSIAERKALMNAMEQVENPGKQRQVRRWAIVLPMAAALLLGVFFYGRHHPFASNNGTTLAANEGTFEINGERFWTLPYSDSDTAANAARVVEMRVPVSSLTEAGLYFDPAQELVSSNGGSSRGSVLADVVLAMDGQPVGIHVIDSEQ